MEKIKTAIKENKAIAIVVLIVIVIFAGVFIRRHYKKAANTPKTAKVKTINADGTPATKKKAKGAAATSTSTSTSTSTPSTTSSTNDAAPATTSSVAK